MTSLEKGFIFFVLIIALTGLLAFFGGYLSLAPAVSLFAATGVSGYLVRSHLPKSKADKNITQTSIFVFISTLLLNSFLFHQRFDASGLVIEIYNTHDALWHIALLKSLAKSIPPEIPVLAEQTLTGYHYFTDLFWVAVHQLSGVSFEVLYLFISPLLMAGLFAFSVVLLMGLFFKKAWMKLLSSAMIIWGGGLAYYAPFLFVQAKPGDSVFWLDQTVQLGINQQLVLALTITNLLLWLVKKSFKKKWWLLCLLLASLAGIKVYAFILYAPILILFGWWQGFNQKNWNVLKGSVIGTVLGGSVLFLNQSHLGWPFIFFPGWFVKTMFESGNHLNYPTWEIHRQLFVNTHNLPRIIFHWGWATLLFIVGNLGPKVVGIALLPIVMLFQKSKLRELAQPLFWATLTVISIIMPLAFIQKGTVWNTIQFMHFAQIPLWLLFIWVIQKLLKKIRHKAIIFLAILLVTLPTTVMMIQFNLQLESYQRFSPELLRQIQALSDLPPKIDILVGSSLYESSLIPAVTGKSVWWSDPGITNILVENTEEYRTLIDQIEAGRTNCNEGQVLVSLEADQLTVQTCPLPVAN